MAIDYEDVFGKIGKFVCATNAMLEIQELIASRYTEDFLDQYTTVFEDSEENSGLIADFISDSEGIEGIVTTQLFYTNRVLAGLQVELNSPDTDPLTILPLLNLRMIEDSATINANVIVTPVITPFTGNSGNGTLLASVVDIEGNDDQRIFDETVQFRCQSDRFTGSDAPVFGITGFPAFTTLSWRALGNGVDSISASIGNSLIGNEDFESFDANIPSSWTTVVGAALIEEETTLQYRGDSCLSLVSDGATAIATLSQDLSLDKDTIYCMTVRLRRGAAAVDGSSNLLIKIDTENETLAAPHILFNENPSSLTDSFQLVSLFFTIADTRDEDQLTVWIDWTDANGVTAAREILVDDVIISPAFIFGNVAYNLIEGSDPFIIDDYIDVETANDNEGLLQSYFGRFYNTQLNSNAAGAETISDLLVNCPSICDEELGSDVT